MNKKQQTGLILEGGAMRGIYTAGVLDVFMEQRLAFDAVFGVSAGAIHGCSFVSGQQGRSIRYYKKYCTDKRFLSFSNLIRTGDLVDEQFCYHDIPERLDPYDYEAFLKSDTKFYSVVTNVETGEAEYLQITDMFQQIHAMRASASMPYVSRIVNYEGRKLLDGGCADSIPVAAAKEMGYQKRVVVLTRQEGYQKKPENTRLAKIMYRKYPHFVQTIRKRHLVYNQTQQLIREQEATGELFVIRPSKKLTIGRMSHNLEEIQETYELGKHDAQEKLPKLREWLCFQQDI